MGAPLAQTGPVPASGGGRVKLNGTSQRDDGMAGIKGGQIDGLSHIAGLKLWQVWSGVQPGKINWGLPPGIGQRLEVILLRRLPNFTEEFPGIFLQGRGFISPTGRKSDIVYGAVIRVVPFVERFHAFVPFTEPDGPFYPGKLFVGCNLLLLPRLKIK